MPELVLLPADAGDKQEFSSQYPATGEHWDKLLTTDNQTTYISHLLYNAWITDLFKIAPTIMGGKINSVTLNYVVGVPGSAARGLEFAPVVKTGGVEHAGSTTTLSGSEIYINVVGSHEFLVNPETSSQWTWSEVYAMQIGMKARNPANNGWIGACTYVDATVDYSADVYYPNIDIMLL